MTEANICRGCKRVEAVAAAAIPLKGESCSWVRPAREMVCGLRGPPPEELQPVLSADGQDVKSDGGQPAQELPPQGLAWRRRTEDFRGEKEVATEVLIKRRVRKYDLGR